MGPGKGNREGEPAKIGFSGEKPGGKRTKSKKRKRCGRGRHRKPQLKRGKNNSKLKCQKAGKKDKREKIWGGKIPGAKFGTGLNKTTDRNYDPAKAQFQNGKWQRLGRGGAVLGKNKEGKTAQEKGRAWVFSSQTPLEREKGLN